jgi:hypothetical protein
MNRVTLATTLCCMMLVLAAATAGAQITDPGDVGGNVFAPGGTSDDAFQPAVTVTPWRSTVLAFRNAFVSIAPALKTWSTSPVRPAHMITRGTFRPNRAFGSARASLVPRTQ